VRANGSTRRGNAYKISKSRRKATWYTLEDTIEVVLGNGNMDLNPEFIVVESVLKVPLSFFFLSYCTCPCINS